MSQWNIKDKTVVITGAARGMGAITARELARQGAKKIILVDWEGEEGTRVRDAINHELSAEVAQFYYCNLGSQKEVNQLADYILETCEQLHVLINNAGITDSVRRLSPEGVDMHVATNHFSHFILSNRLLGLMKRSQPARIIIISSDAHKAGNGVDFNDLNNENLWQGKAVNSYGAFQAYHRSKLCNLYLMSGLVDRLKGSEVTVNAVSPGYFVNTCIYRNTTGFIGFGARMVFGLLGLCGINTPEKGARTHIYLATSEQVSNVTGCYFEHCKEKQISDLARDRQIAEQVWQWTQDQVV